MLSSWRDIAVFLDATAEGERIGRHAAALAQGHNAHLIGVYSVVHTRVDSAASYVRGAAVAAVNRQQIEADEQKALATARHFGDLTREYQIGSELRIVWRDSALDEGFLRTLHADLIVASHPKPADLPGSWSAERLLLSTGIPVLLVPDSWNGETIGANVLIAWNRSREARRAVADAVPFIDNAAKVTILTIDSDHDPEDDTGDPGSNLLQRLGRHGVNAEMAEVASEGRPIAEAILDEAAARAADLVVMGAYSHPRMAEILFGGVTRSLMAQTHLPLLMSR